MLEYFLSGKHPESHKEGHMKAEGVKVTYRDNDNQLVTGVVVGYDQHLRYLIRKDGDGKFAALAVVTEKSIIN